MLQQFIVTPAAGKRLIARALVRHPVIRAALDEATLVVVAGTTNGYVAEELLAATGQSDGFTRSAFRRGVVTPPGTQPTGDEPFGGDVVLVKGVWDKGKQIFDVADDLATGDVILKGANAVDLQRRQAAVLVGHPQAGTAGAAIRAAVGRRVRLMVPIGVEKRVPRPVAELARLLNAPQADGPRLLPLGGEVFTELDAVALLTGAEAHLVAAGGVAGAEGASWLAVEGSDEQCARAAELIGSVAQEPPCLG